MVLDAPGDEHFTQTTIFARAAFPTFVTKLGTQTFVFHTHMVLTAGDTAPPQRFAYIGGSGTLPTFDILSRGGDQMVFLEGLYNFPIETFHVPYLGTPIVTVREMLGKHRRGQPRTVRQQHRRAAHARAVQRRNVHRIPRTAITPFLWDCRSFADGWRTPARFDSGAAEA